MTTSPPPPNLEAPSNQFMNEAQRLADHGMNQVLDHAPEDFSETVFRHVLNLTKGTVCTGESIRLACLDAGIAPHHPNAWGAAINRCVRAGLLTETGRFPRMKSPSSRARRNPEYIRA